MDLSDAVRAAFDDLLDSLNGGPAAAVIEYNLPAPRWMFLCYASEARGLALHGSPNPHITRFEPRKAIDLRDFGDQRAVYAASDGIWPMYFAIIDRERFPTTLINASLRLEDASGQLLPPMYFFSISREALANQAWYDGWVYLLPRETFVPEPPFPFGPYRVHTAQLASHQPVIPLAKLAVSPGDFPFLGQMRGHNNERLAEYAQAMSSGQPLPDDD